MAGAYVYSLTALTGRKRNIDRRIVLGGFDFRRRNVLVVAVAVGISLLPAIIASLIFGPFAFVVVPGLAIAIAFIFFEGRSRKGLRLQLYRALLDKRRANPSDIFLAWRPVEAGLGEGRIVASSIPVEVSRRETSAPVFAGAAQPVKDRGDAIAAALEE